MNVEGKDILFRFLKKNRGDSRLVDAATQLIKDLEEAEVKSLDHLYKLRNGVDKVHNDGFYFFDVNLHRALILVRFFADRAIIVWFGSHKQYMSTFKNNKNSIENGSEKTGISTKRI
ncbi:type II toxin-antitoxin system HigB family toxin [Dyadobacter sandarakinus]|uniref:Type II toxin-antitoxin system HigB family toxin n=1 Tax=Dyadobacter sandarakinus TaxID=2747268 RepID=A0ABX7IC61_9BACT|nr:type II toxin-antitoxin system HigB family toxin [Dyadobacter sandarakinus]QRR03560.1 type II toxin-antitoxin system HigB family toxin [Dyadobacter sandarakinus]